MMTNSYYGSFSLDVKTGSMKRNLFSALFLSLLRKTPFLHPLILIGLVCGIELMLSCLVMMSSKQVIWDRILI